MGIDTDTGSGSGSTSASGSGIDTQPGSGSDDIVATYQWECKSLTLDQISNLAVQSAFTSGIADYVGVSSTNVAITEYGTISRRSDGIFVEFEVHTSGSQVMLLPSADTFSAAFAGELASSADPVASALAGETFVWTEMPTDPPSASPTDDVVAPTESPTPNPSFSFADPGTDYGSESGSGLTSGSGLASGSGNDEPDIEEPDTDFGFVTDSPTDTPTDSPTDTPTDTPTDS